MMSPLLESSQLSVWSQLIHTITQTESLDEIYAAALDALAAGLGVRRAAVLLFDRDGTMRFSAWRGLSDAYRAAVEGHTPWAPRVKGVQPMVVRDVNDNASLAAFLPAFRQEGIAALGFIPLEGADGVIGKFMLYYGEPHAFTPDELEFAGLIAVQVAFAVERTHAHQKIRESAGASQRLAAIVESSDDAILSKDLNGIIMSWNRGAERMFGYSAAEVIGQSIAIIIPPERLFEEDQVLARIRAGQPVEMETVRRRKDGTSIDISLKVSPVKNDDGHIVGASKIARDITARRRSEAERVDLLDEVRRERNAAESARRQAAFLAEVGSVLSRSLDYEQTFAEVARLAVPEIADWCAVDIVDKDGGLQRLTVAHTDPAKVRQAEELARRYARDPNRPGGLMDVIRSGKPSMMENVPLEWLAALAHDDEHLRHLVEFKLTSYLCVPLVSASGTLGAMTFAYAESGRHYTVRDLTFAEDLAARASLAFENALAYRRAHDANRLKDEFLATLSHELRTPLNAIIGYAHMLNMGILNGERQAKAIAVVKRNAEALGQIIADVLDVSRITSGKLRLDVRPVDMEDILRNAIATMQPAADAKGVLLALQIDPTVAKAAGDPDRLQQVVWNLLSNAVKFTPRGGHVQISLERREDAVDLVVRDDGQGIDPSFLPHIFERFRLADSRSSREHGGLGLGLAIVRELVELHGGRVSAASDGLGKGATFHVRLPRTIAESRPAARGARSFTPPPDQELPRLLRGVRVLAVDDEEDALGLLRVVLETAGAEVTTARSAPDAMELLKASLYHAVIADIAMPRTDGLQLIRSIREQLPSPANRIPAAALTAYARSEDRLSALAGGFQVHIAKPVNPNELVLAVAALLGR
jgi:PAS domain S-box-containing protein